MSTDRRRGAYPPRTPGSRVRANRRPVHHTNVGHSILISHVRTFMLVAVFMGGLLGLAIYVTGQAWQRHITRARESRAESRPASQPAEPSPDVGVVVDEASGVEIPRARAELDTESMRRAMVMQARAETLQEAGELEQAIEAFRDALNIWPHLNQVWPRKGEIYLALGRYVHAEQAFERAVETDPANAELLNDLGVAVLYQNRIHPALNLFETVLEVDAAFAPAHFNRALAFLVLDEYEAAEREIDAYLELRTDDPAALKEKAYLQAARADYEGARETLRRALVEAPEWAALYIDAAAVAALQGDIEGAISYLDQAEKWVGPDVITRIYQQPAFRSVRLSQAGLDFRELLEARDRSQMPDEKTIAEALLGTAPMPSLDHLDAGLTAEDYHADAISHMDSHLREEELDEDLEPLEGSVDVEHVIQPEGDPISHEE